jgi:hypothetical protein
VQALIGEANEDVAAHGGFPAEQMGTAGDVEHEAVGRMEANQRRVAVAPVGDGIDEVSIRFLVAFSDHKRRIHGACICKRHVGLQPQTPCSVIHGHNAQRTLDQTGDD